MPNELSRLNYGNGNAYIISNGTSAILVDTCRKKYREKILEACREYPIKLIVLTHGHIDHIENAAYLSEQLQVPIAMHRADLPLLQNNFSQPLQAKTLPGKIVLAASKRDFKKTALDPFTPTVFLSEGDTLDQYGIEAKIIELPGHTQGSIAIEAFDGNLLAGDALMNMFNPTVSLLYTDRQAMLQSAKKITALGKRTIWFGHGGPEMNREWK